MVKVIEGAHFVRPISFLMYWHWITRDMRITEIGNLIDFIIASVHCIHWQHNITRKNKYANGCILHNLLWSPMLKTLLDHFRANDVPPCVYFIRLNLRGAGYLQNGHKIQHGYKIQYGCKLIIQNYHSAI